MQTATQDSNDKATRNQAIAHQEELVPHNVKDGEAQEVKRQVIFGNIPSKSNCYKIITFKSKESGKGHASLAKTPALKKYENDFFIQCNYYRNRNIEGYFELHLDVYYPSQRSDLDNSLKILLDCLQKVKAIKNDNRCVEIRARKFLDANNPRIEFYLKEALMADKPTKSVKLKTIF